MLDTVFDTPLKSAALGIMVVAAVMLMAGENARLGRWIADRIGAGRDGDPRTRFRAQALMLVALALALVLISEAIQ